MKHNFASRSYRLAQDWQYLIANYCKWQFFFTFTYKDLGPSHPEQYSKHLRSFFRKLSRLLISTRLDPQYAFYVVYCYEFQKRGSVHFHCLVRFRQSVNPSRIMFSRVFSRRAPAWVLQYYTSLIWTYGFRHVRLIYNDDVIGYLAKYVNKKGSADNLDFLY